MGILGRLMEMRRRQVLTKRFGKDWGQILFDLQQLPDTPFQLGANGNLTHPPTGLDAEPTAEGIGAAVAGSPKWMNWAAERGLTFSVEDKALYANVDGIRLFLPHRNDYFTLGEVFHEELYRFHMPGSFAFMDIGANLGMASLYLARHNEGPIVAYELVPETAAQARRNLDLNPELSKRIELVEAGLGRQDGTATMRFDRETSAANSIYTQIGGQEVEVRLVDAAAALQQFADAHPDRRLFVKLDAEGAEYDILDRWHEADLLRRIDVLILEWHLVQGRTVDELRERLKGAEFSWFERNHWGSPVGFVTAWRRP